MENYKKVLKKKHEIYFDYLDRGFSLKITNKLICDLIRFKRREPQIPGYKEGLINLTIICGTEIEYILNISSNIIKLFPIWLAYFFFVTLIQL